HPPVPQDGIAPGNALRASGEGPKAPEQRATRGVRGVSPPGKHCEPPAKGRRLLSKGRPGGSGGYPPGETLRASGEGPKAPEQRATPGGYGGKPPGVAFIGVPTGARNAGSGAPTGDQSTGMHVTRPTLGSCQDLATRLTPRQRADIVADQSITAR